MDETTLVNTYPTLYHMAEGGSWSSIAAYGLLSTSGLLDLFGYEGTPRVDIESRHRPESVVISDETHGRAVVRDQKPMSDRGLQSCLEDGITPTQWYELLNRRVFFWTSLDRLYRLLNARPYRHKTHDVLAVRSAPLVQQYRSKITLSPMNSGCTKPFPHARGRDTFLPIAEYPHDVWSAKRPIWDAVVEVAVEGGVPNIKAFVQEVIKMKGKKPLSTVWKPT